MVVVSGIVLGMVGSLHCATMCGPLVMVVNYRQKSFAKNLLYHGSRVVSYMSLGLLLGLIGQYIALAGLQQGLSVLAGVIIIAITWLPGIKVNAWQAGWQQTMLAPMKRRLLSAVDNSKSSTLLVLGFFNGLLPCGMVYVAIAAALATANSFHAALFMVGFGIGTWPLLLSVAMGGSWLAQRFKSKLKFVVPLVALLFGSLLILRGMGLGIPYVSPLLTWIGIEDQITTCTTTINN